MCFFSLIDTFKVEVKTITYDFNDVNNYEKIEKELQDLNIGILGKNVLNYVPFICHAM